MVSPLGPVVPRACGGVICAQVGLKKLSRSLFPVPIVRLAALGKQYVSLVQMVTTVRLRPPRNIVLTGVLSKHPSRRTE